MKKHTNEVDKKEMQGISRRNFLSNTAMAGAGFALTPFRIKNTVT
jgi:hypothetical protein